MEIEGKEFVRDEYSNAQGNFLGENIHEWHKITVQGLEGVLLFAEDRGDSSLDKGILVFGDSSFTTMVLAKFARHDGREKRTIEKILKSVVRVHSFKFFPQETARFKIDLTKTEFRFSNTVTNTFTYTLDGKGNTYIETEIPRINIVQYTKLSTLKQVEHFVNTILTAYIEDGYALSDTKSNSYRVGRINYYETITKGHCNGKTNLIYILLLQDEESTLIFHGMSYTDHEKYLEIFKTTSKTLEFK